MTVNIRKLAEDLAQERTKDKAEILAIKARRKSNSGSNLQANLKLQEEYNNYVTMFEDMIKKHVIF